MAGISQDTPLTFAEELSRTGPTARRDSFCLPGNPFEKAGGEDGGPVSDPFPVLESPGCPSGRRCSRGHRPLSYQLVARFQIAGCPRAPPGPPRHRRCSPRRPGLRRSRHAPTRWRVFWPSSSSPTSFGASSLPSPSALTRWSKSTLPRRNRTRSPRNPSRPRRGNLRPIPRSDLEGSAPRLVAGRRCIAGAFRRLSQWVRASAFRNVEAGRTHLLSG